MVPMAELREFAAGLGFDEVRTLLQSGNLVFKSKNRAAAPLERLLEAEAVKRLKLETEFFVRSAREWLAVIAGNPFREEAQRDPGHLIVMFLKDAPDAARVTALQAAIPGREVLRAKGRELYIVYPDGMGRSKLTSALIDRKLATRGTARNWNTVRKLGALAEA
jgi:uncharacterized protein (DUF1697 family)